MNKKELVEFYQLLIASLEGTISKEQSANLMQILRNDEEAVGYYVDFLSIHTNLYSPGLADSVFEREDSPCEALTNYDSDVWKSLLETEKTAPAIEFPKENSPKIAEIIETEKTPRKINKFSLYTVITASAALALMILFLKFTSPNYCQEVATLTDSINAKWADGFDARIGTRLLTRSGHIQLLKGVAKITYDQGVDLIIEGPAEVELISPSECSLNYGRAYARVSEQGMGFTVVTFNSRIIDMGTEFGVLKNINGSTEVHVIKGKTSLLSGSAKQDKKNQIVYQGQAKQICADTSQVVDIQIDKKHFVRDISSEKNFVWRGEPINLASLVAGGNGFTQGDIKTGIDPATGRINLETIQAYNRMGSGYRRVSGRPAVDGVFVPDGGAGANVVTSAGHTFDAFPDTDSYYWSDITASPYIIKEDYGAIQNLTISLDQSGSKETRADFILLHSNAGITFDLDKIRQSFPQREISGFKSTCGVSQNVSAKKRSEMWVLLDGECVFHCEMNGKDTGVRNIDIPIASQQRFLTLATTDGVDTIIYDWCVFADSVLELISE